MYFTQIAITFFVLFLIVFCLWLLRGIKNDMKLSAALLKKNLTTPTPPLKADASNFAKQADEFLLNLDARIKNINGNN